jgi:uncharacterized protein
MAIYPVKGCGRMELESALVGSTGFEGDREYMIAREEERSDGVHEFITQRHKRTREESRPQSLSVLALIKPELTKSTLRLTWKGTDPIDVDRDQRAGDVLSVLIHNDIVSAVDQGKAAADWLSEHLGLRVRLVKATGPFHRLAGQRYMANDNQIVFQDAYPIHWIMQESVDELSGISGQKIPWTRFRPNIVGEGGEPQVEHEIHEGAVGEVRFVQPKPCTRCPVTTVDQDEGEKRGNEPLTSLSRYKKWERTEEVIFGENMLPLCSGLIRVGDSIEQLSARNPPLVYGNRAIKAGHQ